MIVTLLRHYKVNHKRKKKCTPRGYLIALQEYDDADVVNQDIRLPFDHEQIITSMMKRTKQTFAFLYGERAHEQTDLLNEVPMAPFTEKDKMYSATVFDVMARMQWIVNNSRQPETRKMTTARARKFIETYLYEEKNYLIIGHGFFLRTLSIEMLKYKFKGKAITYLRNGEYQIYKKA